MSTRHGALHRAEVAALRVFGRLPKAVRRMLMRSVTPKHTVGAVCLVRRDDGRVLLVRHSYGTRWGTAGGLSKRGEAPEVTAVRETREEVGLDVELVGEPAVVVEPRYRRVDVVFLARPAPAADPDSATPSSVEILEVGWFAPADPPSVSPEAATAWAALTRRGDLPPLGR